MNCLVRKNGQHTIKEGLKEVWDVIKKMGIINAGIDMEIELIDMWFKKNEFMNVEVGFLRFCFFFFILKKNILCRIKSNIVNFQDFNFLVKDNLSKPFCYSKTALNYGYFTLTLNLYSF